MSDPALVPFIFDDVEHPLDHHFDKNIHDELANLSDDGTIPDEDVYDAINDETFGIETSTLSANDNDLTEFSIRVCQANLIVKFFFNFLRQRIWPFLMIHQLHQLNHLILAKFPFQKWEVVIVCILFLQSVNAEVKQILRFSNFLTVIKSNF
jgi:hypothetical protein